MSQGSVQEDILAKQEAVRHRVFMQRYGPMTKDLQVDLTMLFNQIPKNLLGKTESNVALDESVREYASRMVKVRTFVLPTAQKT